MSDFSKSLNAAEQLKPSGPPMPSRPGNIALTTSVAQSKQAIKQVAPIEDELSYPVAARIGVLGCGQAGGRRLGVVSQDTGSRLWIATS